MVDDVVIIAGMLLGLLFNGLYLSFNNIYTHAHIESVVIILLEYNYAAKTICFWLPEKRVDLTP